jgi:hypothetical protein
MNRIGNLHARLGPGGFGLGDDAPQVVSERRALEGKLAEQRRRTALNEVRYAVYQRACELVRNIEQTVAVRPARCVRQMGQDQFLDAIEVRRRHGREKADLHRVCSSNCPLLLRSVAAALISNSVSASARLTGRSATAIAVRAHQAAS